MHSSSKQQTQSENRFQKARIERIIVSSGIGKIKDPKVVDQIKKDLATITGQKPVVTRSKKSIAGFKLRLGEAVGLMVTLRGKKMTNFFKKLIHVVLPAMRDFKGIGRKSFDKNGNLNLGIREYIVFPEISYGSTMSSHGIEVTVVIRAQSVDQAIDFIKSSGLPIQE